MYANIHIDYICLKIKDCFYSPLYFYKKTGKNLKNPKFTKKGAKNIWSSYYILFCNFYKKNIYVSYYSFLLKKTSKIIPF
jgi:hypothetical protein